MKAEELKLCPFCESPMIVFEDENGKINNGTPYLECSTCGLRFQIEGFDEKPIEIKSE